MPSSSDLAGFVPFKDIADRELTGPAQHVTFDVLFASCKRTGQCVPGCKLGSPGCMVAYTIGGREFSEDHRLKLTVGQAAEWTLISKIASHPYHIHVDPFQVERFEPDGRKHLIWKDTILVNAADPTTKIRMRYADFTGETVFHCHILDHEDQGMMELIDFVR